MNILFFIFLFLSTFAFSFALCSHLVQEKEYHQTYSLSISSRRRTNSYPKKHKFSSFNCIYRCSRIVEESFYHCILVNQTYDSKYKYLVDPLDFSFYIPKNEPNLVPVYAWKKKFFQFELTLKNNNTQPLFYAFPPSFADNLSQYTSVYQHYCSETGDYLISTAFTVENYENIGILCCYRNSDQPKKT